MYFDTTKATKFLKEELQCNKKTITCVTNKILNIKGIALIITKKDSKKCAKIIQEYIRDNYPMEYKKLFKTPKISAYKEKTKIFYSSREWRELRYQVLKEKGAKCCVCGRTPKEHDIVIHCDHIVPLSKDWSKRLDKSNIQIMCQDCNIGKSNKDSKKW